jgi:hypothetical protein
VTLGLISTVDKVLACRVIPSADGCIDAAQFAHLLPPRLSAQASALSAFSLLFVSRPDCRAFCLPAAVSPRLFFSFQAFLKNFSLIRFSTREAWSRVQHRFVMPFQNRVVTLRVLHSWAAAA